MSDWQQGETARLSAQITDVSGQAADPTNVVLKIRTPSGTLVTRSYPAQITRTGVGSYQSELALTEGGTWRWRWETDAPTPGASQGKIIVAGGSI